MIGKVPKKRNDGKSSFRDLVNYIVGNGESAERAVYHQTRNMDVAENDINLAIAEMEGLGTMNARCKDPVFHFILSFRPNETPTYTQVDEAVDIALKGFGLENCKSLYGLQNDNGIHHIHVCVCRIEPETEKAISPANGWTHKAIMRAAREIEFAQGWEIEKSDPIWKISQTGEITQKENTRSSQPKLDSNAKDFEAHTGEKSAQRIAIDCGAEIIRKSRSWRELHEKLSEVGLRFELKGSGAVVVVNDEIVKASNVGRDCSLSKLEKRLGVFCANEPTKGEIAQRESEPTEQTETTPQTLSAWQKYQLYKEGYQEQKKVRDEMFLRHKGERKELKSKQKAERDTLFKQSWKGRGNELNMRRGEFTGKHLKEELALQKMQQTEQQALGEKTKFLSWRKWLAENDAERIEELRRWKKTEQEREEARRGLSVIGNMEPFGAITTIYVVQRIDFSGYVQTKNLRGNCYEYSLDGKNVAFADYDKRIDVFKNDESAIFASLQLAHKKWGGVKIEGNEQYLNTCMRLAEEHGIKLQVPEEHLGKLEILKTEEPKEPQKIEMIELIPEPVNKLKLARELATEKHKAGRVVNALLGSSYEGTVEDKQHGYLLLRTGKDEITILNESGLKTSPKVGERISVEANYGNGRSVQRVSAVKDRGIGR